MPAEIRLEPVSDGCGVPEQASGSLALQTAAEERITLVFRIVAPDSEALEALRHARRSMLREEWTLGRGPDEPALETAIFSPTDVTWTVSRWQRENCLRRLDELVSRANRALAQLRSP